MLLQIKLPYFRLTRAQSTDWLNASSGPTDIIPHAALAEAQLGFAHTAEKLFPVYQRPIGGAVGTYLEMRKKLSYGYGTNKDKLALLRDPTVCGVNSTSCYCADEVSQFDNEHDELDSAQLSRRAGRCSFFARLYSYPQTALVQELLTHVQEHEHAAFLCFFRTLYEDPVYTGQCTSAEGIAKQWRLNLRKGWRTNCPVDDSVISSSVCFRSLGRSLAKSKVVGEVDSYLATQPVIAEACRDLQT